ncbi:MAG TPA: sigma-70 family RNA polymerase sigma factor [Polyangiaceae bacterium]|nr:sigma-70 family RNA polymerase sigma factor [Polyangiaceae bacterium]
MEPSFQESVESTLEALMERYASGDESAFRELHRRMAPKLLGHLMKLSRNPAIAEDALQNAFIKLHRARETYVRGAPVTPWVLVIARRALYDELRSMRTRVDVLSDDGALPERVVDDSQSKDDARELELALAALPDHYRDAIELTKLQGLSGGEAAAVLSTTQSAIKLRVHRGYRLLREHFEAQAA